MGYDDKIENDIGVAMRTGAKIMDDETRLTGIQKEKFLTYPQLFICIAILWLGLIIILGTRNAHTLYPDRGDQKVVFNMDEPKNYP